MPFIDDDLTQLQAHGLPSLPEPRTSGYVDNEGARIWHARFGAGPPVVLLHGGLGNAGNWAYQVPALVEAGYSVILIDSRGQDRSTRDAEPYSYDLMTSDTCAVMDALGIASAALSAGATEPTPRWCCRGKPRAVPRACSSWPVTSTRPAQSRSRQRP